MHSLIFDVGKTHIKLQVLDQWGNPLCHRMRDNSVLTDGPYPHFDVEAIWTWFLRETLDLTDQFDITSLIVATHGACVALVDHQDRLSLPILDYEYPGVANCSAEYQKYRPPFELSYSPDLPLGLNLGRQLFWLQNQFPEAFLATRHFLLYPQYWAWRLTGQFASERTSLGCHTDLWLPLKNDYSALVISQGWEKRFPPLRNGWDSLGPPGEYIRQQCGLSDKCQVYVGVHDSNASYLRYLNVSPASAFTVVSTGTWSIAMASGVPISNLNTEKDMLANVDVQGAAIACSRSMAGREYEVLCRKCLADPAAPTERASLQNVIDNNIYALPGFSHGGGPFVGCVGEIIGRPAADNALATLYSALLLDYQLALLGCADGDVYIEGAFVNNALLCSLLAQLRPEQTTYVSADSSGTGQGCAQLINWNQKPIRPKVEVCCSENFSGLNQYRDRWLSLVNARPETREKCNTTAE